MRCPIDNESLLITERNGVEIDYCPRCRGVWLDRGELDKLIERGSFASERDERRPEPKRRPAPRSDDRYDEKDYYKKRKNKKVSSFLEEIFDF